MSPYSRAVILGLVPRIHPASLDWTMTYCTYILASKKHGTLYVGITNDLPNRVVQHKQGTGSVFTRRYKVHKLVYYEQYDDIRDAIQREKSLKRYLRAWKINLIEQNNPDWSDLSKSFTA